MHVALITAGGAGMFCGSCMHDNTLARALLELGHEASLVPCYTPLRVDEPDVSGRRVFLGGVNVYLDARLPGWSRLPRFLTRWLDSAAVLSAISRLTVSADAAKLGQLTLSLLAGDQGPQRPQIEELAQFVSRELRPDIVCFSNALMAGALPRLRREYPGPVVCLLQGDDIFLDGLIEPYRTQALERISSLAQQFDGFLVHSEFYRDLMTGMLRLPRNRMHVTRLGIDLAGHDGLPREDPSDPFTVGYFARICPEKGLQHLLDGFRSFHRRHPRTRLVAGGYLGERDRKFFENLRSAARDLGTAFEYVGSPAGHAGKVEFLKSLDVLSVPTEYREPKGLYVLEALANGVPVVQPRHGAFPEMLAATRGGLLTEPGDPDDLSRALETLLLDSPRRRELASRGREAVHTRFNHRTTAEATLRVFESYCGAERTG